jgi:diguanylate cyclase (GGDEF)-like protein/PAS domain S-box-containing protein
MDGMSLEQTTMLPFRLSPQTAFFRSLVDKSPDLILVLDRLQRIRFANPSVEKLLGYRGDEILYQTLRRLIDTRDIAVFDQVIRSVQGSSRGSQAQPEGLPEADHRASLRLVCKDGSRRVLDCIFQDHFADPLVGGLMVNGHDTTQLSEIEAAMRQDQIRFNRTLEAVPSILLVVDPQGKISWVNSRACDFLGYPSALLVGMDFFDHFIPAKYRSDVIDRNKQILNDPAEAIHSEEFSTITVKGDEHRVAWRVGLLKDQQGAVQGTLYAGEDITALRSSEAALKISQERYMLALRGANDGIWDWNIQQDEFYVSPRWKEILGYAENELKVRPELFWAFVHPEDQVQFKAAVDSHLKGITPKLEMEIRMLQKEGDVIWALIRGLATLDEEGTATRMAGSISDITARKHTEQRLVFDALHDALTGLPNRLLFFDRLERAIKRFKRNPGYPYAVLYMDLDHFKVINDSMGHHYGDQLLVAFGQRIMAGMRSVDTLARVGGDEFVILLEELLSMHDAKIVVNRILEQEKVPFILDGKEFHVSVSIGVVDASQEYSSPQEVLRDADIAMYNSKAQGRGQAVLFKPEMRSKAIDRLEIEVDLRDALRKNQLELHYQPIIDLTTMEVVGFEALLRWRNPQRGLLYPAEFLQVAEEAGLLSNLENWVLWEACRQIQQWRRLYPIHPALSISVNISGKHFQDENLPLQIEEIALAAGLEPGTLQLELVESALLDPSGQVLHNLERIHALGVGLHVDDFGTGYSSLSYLHSLPLDMIKIDRSFIARIGAGNTELVHSIIRLAQELKVRTVAEGVETAVQFERLRSFGCQYGQGFFLGHPLPKHEVDEFLTKLARQRHIL